MQARVGAPAAGRHRPHGLRGRATQRERARGPRLLGCRAGRPEDPRAVAEPLPESPPAPDFIAPDGSLYRSLSRPLTATDGDAPVETLLPVNGTWITRYSLYGAWCVEAFLDQEQEPVASSRLVISAQR